MLMAHELSLLTCFVRERARVRTTDRHEKGDVLGPPSLFTCIHTRARGRSTTAVKVVAAVVKYTANQLLLLLVPLELPLLPFDSVQVWRRRARP